MWHSYSTSKLFPSFWNIQVHYIWCLSPPDRMKGTCQGLCLIFILSFQMLWLPLEYLGILLKSKSGALHSDILIQNVHSKAWGSRLLGSPWRVWRQHWGTLNRPDLAGRLDSKPPHLLDCEQLSMCLFYLFSLLPKVYLNTDSRHLNKNWSIVYVSLTWPFDQCCFSSTRS